MPIKPSIYSKSLPFPVNFILSFSLSSLFSSLSWSLFSISSCSLLFYLLSSLSHSLFSPYSCSLSSYPLSSLLHSLSLYSIVLSLPLPFCLRQQTFLHFMGQDLYKIDVNRANKWRTVEVVMQYQKFPLFSRCVSAKMYSRQNFIHLVPG